VDMSGMFCDAIVFNQSLSRWKLKKVENISCMFAGATQFNQPLNTWNIKKVTDMSCIFHNSGFNQSIASWKLPRGVSKSELFGDLMNI
jgi:surface protein